VERWYEACARCGPWLPGHPAGSRCVRSGRFLEHARSTTSPAGCAPLHIGSAVGVRGIFAASGVVVPVPDGGGAGRVLGVHPRAERPIDVLGTSARRQYERRARGAAESHPGSFRPYERLSILRDVSS